MVQRKVSLGKISEFLILKEREESWSPDKHSLDVLVSRGYTIGETIGEGKYSKIKKAECKNNKEPVAIKVINKCRMRPKDQRKFLPREIEILRAMQHPGLVDIIELIESERQYYIVMDFAPNGDLADFINKVGCLTEADSRRFFKQLINVVTFLHENMICHRDIKCENILLDKCFNIRLADFGFARTVSNKQMLETNCGSYVYAAPEILDGDKYDGFMADIWSVGVCLYCMLNGRLPFRDDDIDILRYSMAEKLKFYKYASKDCRVLLRQILSTDPTARPCLKSIVKHRWMCKPLKQGAGQSSVSSMAIEAVTEHHVELDPNAEHGFNCDQQSRSNKTTRVKDMLTSVATVHSSGESTVDLTKVPEIKNNSSALLTGVTGPIGKRLSQQLLPVVQESPKEKKLLPNLAGNKFSKAAKAMRKFRVTAKVVTAVQRFRRSPLNTILTIPQEKAFELIIEHNNQHVEQEKRQLHRCQSGKVAKRCLQGKHQKYEQEMQPIRERIKGEKEVLEKKELLRSTACHLLPAEMDDDFLAAEKDGEFSTAEKEGEFSTDDKDDEYLPAEMDDELLEN